MIHSDVGFKYAAEKKLNKKILKNRNLPQSRVIFQSWQNPRRDLAGIDDIILDTKENKDQSIIFLVEIAS